jgi:hypothetical protein
MKLTFFKFPNSKLLDQNNQYSIKKRIKYKVVRKITIIVHNKMVMELMHIMNLVECAHNFWK